MKSWGEGYRTDLEYNAYYFRELNSLFSKFVLNTKGIRFPVVHNACELGFGQGVSLNVHSAASDVKWWGTDFSPSMTAFAKETSESYDTSPALFEQAFMDFCNRPDLPCFEFIAMHGIWSWISKDNQEAIVDFIKRKLSPGGVLYVSYNVNVGWTSLSPVREILNDHFNLMNGSGRSVVSNLKKSLEFAERALEASDRFKMSHPTASERFKVTQEKSMNYLAHEYLNENWNPISFMDAHRNFSSAKLSWGCSANMLDSISEINFNSSQIAILEEIDNIALRQAVVDLFLNTQFRKDYWVKGARTLSDLEQAEQLRAQRIVLTVRRADVNLKVKGGLGEATMQDTVYNPILNALADHKVKTLGQLEQELKASKDGGSITFAELLQAALVLGASGAVAVAQDDSTAQKLKKQTDKLNRHIMLNARSGGDFSVLASPVTGGGVIVARTSQLFLLARENGRKDPADWAKFVWDILAAQGQRVIKDGKALDTAEENISQLTEQAMEFAAKQLPILKALKVA